VTAVALGAAVALADLFCAQGSAAGSCIAALTILHPHSLLADLPLVRALCSVLLSCGCRQDQAFNIVDIKPQSMEDLTEVGGQGAGAVGVVD
jgi:hypothetical protein